jgi:hypothetical protein
MKIHKKKMYVSFFPQAFNSKQQTQAQVSD